MDVRLANKLFEQMERLSAEASEVRDALRIEFLSSQLGGSSGLHWPSTGK